MNTPEFWTVIGLGNLLFSDDGAGIRALQSLENDSRLPAGTWLLDGGTLGVQLTAYVNRNSRLLFLDAVDVGAKPGTIVFLQKEELSNIGGVSTAHDLGLRELLAALRITEQEPTQIMLLGIQPGSTLPGIELSLAVTEALPHYVDAVLTILSGDELDLTSVSTGEHCYNRNRI